MKIIFLPNFRRKYKKLPNEIKDLAEKREGVFRKNPFDPLLKTHKLHGGFRKFWSFSISQKHRVVFKFIGEDTAVFYSIGDHSIY